MTQPAEAGLLQSLSPLLYYYDQIYPNQNLRKISTTSAASLLFALARFSFLLKKILLQYCVAGNQGFVSCS